MSRWLLPVRRLGIDSMAVDVTSILKGLLDANRGPDPANPDARQLPTYGVTASLEGDVLDIVLTFKRGHAYCCMEWGCHLALFNGRRWQRLHESLAQSGVVAPQSLRLHLLCKIEEGAVSFDFSKPDRSRRGWYAFAPVAAHDYKVVTVEASGDSSGREPITES